MRNATTKGSRRVGPPLRNFHLPLPQGVYEALHHEASRLGKPATAVAREAIELWLQERTSIDLDADLEKAALEAWRVRKPRR